MASDDRTMPCPLTGTGGGVGGMMLTACVFCGEVSPSTAGGRHRPIVLRELAERLRLADEIERLRESDAEWDALFNLWRPLMEGTVNALKGEPPAHVWHDLSDLPVVARRVMSVVDAAVDHLKALSELPQRDRRQETIDRLDAAVKALHRKSEAAT